MTEVKINITPEKVAHQHPFQGWQEVKIPDGVRVNDEEKMLLAVNDLLAKKRPFAMDHEKTGEVFLGASLVRTAQGRYFIKANIQLPASPTSRNCSETGAVTDAVEIESGHKTQITDLWFMGGKGVMNTPGTLEDGVMIIERDKGKRYFPCGSCLNVIWDNRVNRVPGEAGPETRVHILPLNDGDLEKNGWGGKLQPYDGRELNALAPNQVLTKTITELLPNVTYSLADPSGSVKQVMRAGWEMMMDKGTGEAIRQALDSDALVRLNATKGLPAGEVTGLINDIMVDTIRDMYARSSKPLKSARVVVVRMDNGEYYMGESLDNGVASSMEHGEFKAIDAMLTKNPTGHAATDIFVMAVDFDKIPDSLAKWDGRKDAPVEVDMPNGYIRRRISSVSPNNGDVFTDLSGHAVDKATGATVHVMLPNNKVDFDPLAHDISMPLAKLLPYRYISNKMDKELQQTHLH